MLKRYSVLSLCLICSLLLIAKPAARIGNRSYTLQELEDGFSAYLQYQNRQNMSAADSLALFSLYFDELIGMYIYNQAIAEGMVTVSEQELEQEVMNNAPTGIQALQDFSTSGRFDLQKYQQALRENPEFKKSVMDFSRDVFAYRKLVRKIRSEAVVDSQQVKTQWLAQGNTADAAIIVFDYNRLSDIEAGREDAQRLYDENIAFYRRENGRNLRYVGFRGLNSRENAGKREQIEAQSRRMHQLASQKGLDAAAQEMALEINTSPYFSREDSIVRGIGRDEQLVARSFMADPGTLMDLYVSPFGDIFILEVGADVAQYHIPFEVEEQLLMLRARALKRQAALRERVQQFIRNHNSRDYLAEAQKAGYPVINAQDLRLDGDIEGIGHVEALNRAILGTQAGEFSALVEQDGNYYLAFVEQRSIRSNRAWEAQKHELLGRALAEEQTRHLDAWYLQRLDLLEIVYPETLRNN